MSDVPQRESTVTAGTPGPASGSAAPVFATTRWTLVRRAQGGSPEARVALGELCEAYWTPVFRFLRREGRDEDAARELTQEFFARVLARGDFGPASPERGRFRSYLLGAVKHFLADQRDRDARLKRGGGAVAESLDAEPGTSAGVRKELPSAMAPDSVFDREWALAVMARALSAVEAEFQAEGRGSQFVLLKPWLVGETPTLSQADAAQRLGTTEGAVKVAVHRLRRRFRERVRAEIAQTLDDPAEVATELRYLVEVLAAG